MQSLFHDSGNNMPDSLKSQAQFPRPEDCICEGRQDHPIIDTRNSYSFWGWLGVLTGISIRPRKVTYWCTRCNIAIGESQDQKALNRYL